MEVEHSLNTSHIRDTAQPSDKINPCGDPDCNKINSGIDKCIKPLVFALNNAGLKTIASCCGHGNTLGNVALSDGREIMIAPDYDSARKIESGFPDIHGNSNKDTCGRSDDEKESLAELLAAIQA